MPLMLELKYEYFPNTWPGRIKLLELVFGLLCMMCAAPAYYTTQHWFLLVVTVAFIGSILFSLYYLCLAEPLNKLNVNWVAAEFWFTAGSAFLYFTAFLAQLVEFAPLEDANTQTWIDAQIAAGVFGLLNDICYAVGAYLIYIDWQRNPSGMAPSAPTPA